MAGTNVGKPRLALVNYLGITADVVGILAAVGLTDFPEVRFVVCFALISLGAAVALIQLIRNLIWVLGVDAAFYPSAYRKRAIIIPAIGLIGAVAIGVTYLLWVPHGASSQLPTQIPTPSATPT